MKIVLLIIVVAALSATAYRSYEFMEAKAACIGDCDDETSMSGSGKITTETRTVGPFTSIHLDGIGNASVARTGAASLSISVDDNLAAFIVSEVKDGALYLSIKRGVSIRTAHLEYRITVGDLREIAVSGSTSLQAEDLEGAALSVAVSGAGRARLSGRSDSLTAAVSGSGSLDAAALNAKRATIRASGSGSAIVDVSDTLDATASGAGSIEYLGAPRLETHISGAGSVDSR